MPAVTAIEHLVFEPVKKDFQNNFDFDGATLSLELGTIKLADNFSGCDEISFTFTYNKGKSKQLSISKNYMQEFCFNNKEQIDQFQKLLDKARYLFDKDF